ncbi:hypothetical protein BaRGS_00007341 [Batillaria attramentaria]|uniref:Uncharacterized protein n=1 Tax=Batillaria attramentaria TaxID=370345 RepID=A0ABD0LR97_9CAEN
MRAGWFSKSWQSSFGEGPPHLPWDRQQSLVLTQARHKMPARRRDHFGWSPRLRHMGNHFTNPGEIFELMAWNADELLRKGHLFVESTQDLIMTEIRFHKKVLRQFCPSQYTQQRNKTDEYEKG